MDRAVHKLALLLILCEEVDNEKKDRASARTLEVGTLTPPMTNLKSAFRDLFSAYDLCLVLYIEAKRAKANKSVCLPSLDHQQTGPLRYYSRIH